MFNRRSRKPKPIWRGSKRKPAGLGRIESLEQRVLLAGQVLISEFMADNQSTLRDVDGEFSDWIELYNAGDAAVNLNGWNLTDNPLKLDKWRFPAVTLLPNHFLTVFASNKDRAVVGQELHTNFKLDKEGEYLALVEPDDHTVAQAFDPYPPQATDVSYGLSPQVTTTPLVGAGAAVDVIVPANNTMGDEWTRQEYVKGAHAETWTAGQAGVGFDTGQTDDDAFLQAMLELNPTAYWRLEETGGTLAANVGSEGSLLDATYTGSPTLGNAGPRSPEYAGIEPDNRTGTFDGINDYIKTGKQLLSDRPTFSMMGWIRPNTISGTRIGLWGQNDAVEFGFISPTTLQIWTPGGGALDVTYPFAYNEWHHVAVVGDGSNLKMYLDGTLVGVGGGPTADYGASGDGFNIGGGGVFDPTGNFYYGAIDEVGVFEQALTAEQVASVFSAAEKQQVIKPVSRWTFDNNSGADSIGGNNGPVVGATYVASPWGKALNMDGAGDYMLVSGGSTFSQLKPTADVTVAVWVNRQDTGDGEVMSMGDHYGIRIKADGSVIFFIDVSPTSQVYQLIQTNPSIPAEKIPIDALWHHVVAMKTDAGLELWIDGQKSSATLATTTAINYSQGGASMYVGRFGTGAGTMDFAGKVDDLAIWPRTLKPAQIAYLAARGDPTALQESTGSGGNDAFAPFIATDLTTAMHDVIPSAYLRTEFSVADPSAFNQLILKIRYDDGFVAFLNGVEIGSRNAPDVLAYNSAATSPHPDPLAIELEEIDVSEGLSALRAGNNVLAIQGMNRTATGGDFLIDPQFDAAFVEITGGQNGYMTLPTPGLFNSPGTTALPPLIADVSHSPSRLVAGQAVVVTARLIETIHAVSSANLTYRVMYGGSTSIAMNDAGTGGDAVAADGIWSATIPANAALAGQMLRYFVTATDSTNASGRSPRILDTTGDDRSPEYYGTVVANPAVNSAIPVFEWFTTDVNNSRTRTGARASVYYNGEFYDNIFVRQRGGFTNAGAQKFDFNEDHKFFVNDVVGRVEEINLNSNGSDAAFVRQPMGFELYRSAGNAAEESFFVLMRLNSGADRVGIYVEQVDAEFLKRRGLDPEGAMYKFLQRADGAPFFLNLASGVEKKTRITEPMDDLQALVNGVNLPTQDQRTKFLFDNFNIPQWINYLAVRAIERDADDYRKNFYFYRDTNGDKEWSIFPWDKDWTFGVVGDTVNNGGHPFAGDAQHAKDDGQYSILWDVFFKTPEIKAMYLRRLRSLMDQFLQPPSTPAGQLYFEKRVDEWFAPVASLLGAGPAGAIPALKGFFPARRTDLYVTHAFPNGAGIPAAQSADPSINFGAYEVNPASGNQDEEYIQLINPNADAVDISGWTIEGGISLTFKPGTVIPANGSVYISPDVAAFRARTTGPRGGQGLFIQGAYTGHLSSFGETITLKSNSGAVIATLVTPPAPSAQQQFLRISELMYDPIAPTSAEIAVGFTDNDDFEFIELTNIGPAPLDIGGAHFSAGVDFAFPAGMMLDPGTFIVIARNPQSLALRHGPGLPIAGAFANGTTLDNSGELIKLEDSTNSTIQEFNYSPIADSHDRTDAHGSSLEVVDAALPAGDSANWRSSYEFNGSPGRAGLANPNDIVINEILANTDVPDLDSIELHNNSANPIDLSGWFLSDRDDKYQSYRIPDGTILDAGGYVVFDEADFNTGPGQDHFALDGSRGDDVYLLSATPAGTLLAFADVTHFEAMPAGESIGRWLDGSGKFYPMSAFTPGLPNSGPRIGPAIITEVMYQPSLPDDNLEFIEIQNLTDSNLDISNWQFDRGITFTFPAASLLQPHQPVLVVHFDPHDLPLLNAFRSHYALDPAIPVFGPYTGFLSDNGELLRLVRPDAPPIDDPTYFPLVLVDETDYSALAPWPTGAAGTGASMSRITNDIYADAPAAWSADAPTPGSMPFGDAYFQGDVDYSYADSISLDSLTVRDTSLVSLALGGNRVLSTPAISLDPSATLDLADNDLIVQSDALGREGVYQMIQSLIGSARAGGAWNGPGITSSTAAADPAGLTGLAEMLNDDGTGGVIHSVFSGQSADANAILVKYTWNGDADLSGVVDADDYFRIDSGFASSGALVGYSNGDFDYSGTVDADDYFLIDSAFAGQGGVLGKAKGKREKEKREWWDVDDGR